MDFNEYRINAKRKILEEVDYRLVIRLTRDMMTIYFCKLEPFNGCLRYKEVVSRPILINWLKEHDNMFEIIEIKERAITVKLLNCPPQQPETEYDKEIKELEEKLNKLKQLRKKELSRIKKENEIAKLKNKIKELQKEG